MNDLEKYGYYLVNNNKFINKYDALIFATKNNSRVKFIFHDNLWENFNRNLLGKISLNTLYQTRAQQLRDEYDYLILYYSGGSDSHNILKTFIDNNIKLDEICVNWPKQLMDGKFYKPNTKDSSAKNYWSEWNFSIKPVLNWLSKNHPKIKIQIEDYAKNLFDLNFESFFETSNNNRAGSIMHNNIVSSSEKIIGTNKSVAHIYGIDKPILTFDNQKNTFGMFFSDNVVQQVGFSKLYKNSTELFYWSPNLPLLAFEQAYKLCLYYESNKQDLKYLFDPSWPKISKEERNIKIQVQQDIGRKILYDNWDNRFQTEKPKSDLRTDKFFWFFEHPEMNKLKTQYIDNLNERNISISQDFLLSSKNDPSMVYRANSTKNFFIKQMN